MSGGVLQTGWDDGSRFRQRRLIVLAVVCSVALSVFGLAENGPSDAQIEGNQRTVEASR